MNGFATRAVHASGKGWEEGCHHPLRPPVHDSVAFAFESASGIAAAFSGSKPAHSYSRITNPTVADFESRVQSLSGGRGVVALASGMAAITTTIMALAGAGSNIVASRFLFGNTISLLTHTLAPWGLKTRFVDISDLDAVARAIDENTRAIFCESITNPQLEVADIRGLATLARERGVPLVLDNTAPTFYLCPAGELGADIEIISSTKYISGGGSSVGGLIIDHGSFPWNRTPRLEQAANSLGPFAFLAALRRETARNLGACLAPHNAYLQTLGLETLALRVEQSCNNAMALARYLRQNLWVSSVNYPGLPDHPHHHLAREQFGGRYGGVLTFELTDKEHCFACQDRLRLIQRATNINDNKTLAIHPASTILHEFSQKDRKRMGVSEKMLRISTGIEDVRDLEQDLEQAIQAGQE